MKKIIVMFLSIVAIISANSLAFASEDNHPVKVIAYYFHGTFRCYACTNMEKYSREVVDTNFKDAIVSGNLEFKVINVEDRGNEHFVKDYQLYTKAFILSLVKDGKEIKSKNLDKIWEYAGDKKMFIYYVTNELNDFLKDAK